MLNCVEIQEDLSNGYIDRQKMRDLTRQVHGMFRTESRSELLRETVREAVANLEPIDICPTIQMHPTQDDRSLVLALGDFHYGAEINVTGLRGEI